jgi:3-oxoacyl-[acyl-carrier protein] reductase
MVIMITGASRGIGASLAQSLTSSGNTVLLVSRNRTNLEKVVKQCNDAAGKVLAFSIPFDLTDLTELEDEFLSQVRGISPSLDGLVNNAGQLIRKPFSNTNIGEARALFEANFFAPAQLTRICLPLLEKSELRHVVNITSMAGYQGASKFSGLSYYSASKAALGSLTECLAEELQEEGVKVNALAIGSVQTEMLALAFPGLKAPLEPPQMAEFMSWFVLEACQYFNGKVLPVSLSTP